MKKTLFTFVLALFCSFTFGQYIINQPSEARSTALKTTLKDNIVDGYVPEQKTKNNTLSFQLEDKSWYVLTYELRPEYKCVKYGLFEFSGERDVYLYRIDKNGESTLASSVIYTHYSDRNSYAEIFPYTIWKGSDLATGHIWNLGNDSLIVMFIPVHEQLPTGETHRYNDIVFFKMVREGFYETIVFTPQKKTISPSLVPDSYVFKDNIITFEMINGDTYEFGVSVYGEIYQKEGSKLEKNESSAVYTDNGN